MNPNIDPKFAAEKRLRALERERNHLLRLDRDAPIIPLDEPYQRGWERWFEWSEAALRRDDAHRFIEILPVIQRIDLSKRIEFEHYSWQLGRWVEWPHEPRKFSLKSFRALRLPKELLGYFETHRHDPLSSRGCLDHLRRARWGGGIHFRYPEYLVSKKGPHLITHRKVNLPEVTSRLAEIDQIMESCRGWQKLHRICGKGYRFWRRTDRQRLLEKVHRREMKTAWLDWQEMRNDKGAARSAPFSLACAVSMRENPSLPHGLVFACSPRGRSLRHPQPDRREPGRRCGVLAGVCEKGETGGMMPAGSPACRAAFQPDSVAASAATTTSPSAATATSTAAAAAA